MSRVLSVHFFLAIATVCMRGKQSHIDMVWHNFPPDRSPLTINHREGPFIKWPRRSGPLVTHKRFSNLKFDIDGALRLAAGFLSLAGANIALHMLTLVIIKDVLPHEDFPQLANFGL